MSVYTDDELDDLMRENLALTKENNKLLRKMHRAQVWASIFRFLWLALMIGVPIWFYLSYVEPYMKEMMGTYNQLQGQVEGLEEMKNSLPSREDLPDWAQALLGGNSNEYSVSTTTPQ